MATGGTFSGTKLLQVDPEARVFATLRVTVFFSTNQAAIADSHGVGPEEQNNFAQQMVGEVLDLMGNTEEA